MKLPPLKREKFADQLNLVGQPPGAGHAGRPPARPHRAAQSPYHLILPNGREYISRIIDISISGAALSAAVEPPIGTPVTVGQTRAQIVRTFPSGLAVEFVRPFTEDEFSENIRL